MVPAEKNYRCYRGWIPTTGAERTSDTVVFFPPRRCTYALPAPPTQEEVVQEAEKALVNSLRALATNNPAYTHMSNFSGLQQISDIINSAAKKASFHREDAHMKSQLPQHRKRCYRRQKKLSSTVSERWQQTTQHTRICTFSLALNKCLTSSTQQRKKL